MTWEYTFTGPSLLLDPFDVRNEAMNKVSFSYALTDSAVVTAGVSNSLEWAASGTLEYSGTGFTSGSAVFSFTTPYIGDENRYIMR